VCAENEHLILGFSEKEQHTLTASVRATALQKGRERLMWRLSCFSFSTSICCEAVPQIRSYPVLLHVLSLPTI